MHPWHWNVCTHKSEMYAPMTVKCMHPWQWNVCTHDIEMYAPIRVKCMHPWQWNVCTHDIEMYAPIRVKCMHPWHWNICTHDSERLSYSLVHTNLFQFDCNSWSHQILETNQYWAKKTRLKCFAHGNNRSLWWGSKLTSYRDLSFTNQMC